MATAIREQLHKQIDTLPDEMVQVIADFASFIMTRRQIASTVTDWENLEWQTFALDQFLREDDPVEYTLKDAQEVYHP